MDLTSTNHNQEGFAEETQRTEDALQFTMVPQYCGDNCVEEWLLTVSEQWMVGQDMVVHATPLTILTLMESASQWGMLYANISGAP